jgi:hypothetical protein
LQFEVEVVGDELQLSGSLLCQQATEYLARQPRAHWPHFLKRALEVGAFCLERASTSQDMEFVRRQADRLMTEVAAAVRTIPTTVTEELVRSVGTSQGQVLAPIAQLVSSTATMAERSVAEARRLLQDMDPARDDGTVGRALKSVRDLLDAERKDSVQSRIESAVDALGDQGGQFAKLLKIVIGDARRRSASGLTVVVHRGRTLRASMVCLNQRFDTSSRW